MELVCHLGVLISNNSVSPSCDVTFANVKANGLEDLYYSWSIYAVECFFEIDKDDDSLKVVTFNTSVKSQGLQIMYNYNNESQYMCCGPSSRSKPVLIRA